MLALLLACAPDAPGPRPRPEPEPEPTTPVTTTTGGPTCTPAAGGEVCNGADDDCDGLVDDDDPDRDPASTRRWYTDADGDGLGDPDTKVRACAAGPQQVADGTDCNDERADRPAAWWPDQDGDGVGAGATVTRCKAPERYVLAQGDEDCDDEDPRAWPGATEICLDLVDQDCDGTDVACTIPLVGDLSIDQLGLRVTSDRQLGSALAVGDPDGNGVRDLVIGDRTTSPDGTVSVVPLPLVGTRVVDTVRTAALTDTTGWYRNPIGEEVAVGDFDGDGVEDIASAYYSGVEVWSGPVAGSIDGQARTKLYAHDVAELAAGDLNGDGVADLLVRDWLVGVWMGPLPEGYQSDPMYGDASLWGGDDDTTAVATGDLDGDGLDDVLVGLGRDGVGVALSPLAPNVFDSAYDRTLANRNPDVKVTTLAPPVDLDGDGRLDLLVGAPTAIGGASPGQAWVWLDPLRTSLPAAAIEGPADNLDFGQSVATADLDADGALDVAVALASPDGDVTRGVSVFLDPPRGLVDGWSDATAHVLTENWSSVSLSGVGDVSGDGVEDLLLREWGNGVVYALLGTP